MRLATQLLTLGLGLFCLAGIFIVLSAAAEEMLSLRGQALVIACGVVVLMVWLLWIMNVVIAEGRVLVRL